MLMYLTFSNLNSIHWIIKKKDIGLYVLFRTFHEGTYKVRNEIETKRNQRKRNEMKRNEAKSTKTKRNRLI